MTERNREGKHGEPAEDPLRGATNLHEYTRKTYSGGIIMPR